MGYEVPRPPDGASPWKGGGPTAQAQGKAWLSARQTLVFSLLVLGHRCTIRNS